MWEEKTQPMKKYWQQQNWQIVRNLHVNYRRVGIPLSVKMGAAFQAVNDTLVGEGGSTLSGGEKQRISIARAFLKNAPIILLDEATASLDVENETVIQTALSRLIQNKTVLVIAHRMRTVASADKIVVLEKGKVAQEGNSAELMNSNGIYHHMVTLQTESQNWTLE